MNKILSGALRGVMAEAARAERIRILELLDEQSLADRQVARQSSHPRLTGAYKRAQSIDYAADLIVKRRGSSWVDSVGEHYATIETPCDSVDLAWYDPDPDGPDWDEEPSPIRLVVNDGAESITATAYLDLEGAEQLVADLLELIGQRRAARESRGQSSD